ncbi:MAG: hypothetical protein CMB68_01795 [Euryarchaeota archaeon]|nr:hypothetical protein [Euryarchaeota archaeon]MBK33543.1 hypothetical protein [Chloroflexota bacterium]
MSPIFSLTIFILALAFSSEIAKKDSGNIAGILLLSSLAYLYIYGPSALGFGLCIGSGWTLLNQAAFQMFPQ